MLIITTGISGCGRKDYLEKFQKMAAAHKKKIKIYNVGEMLFEQATKIGLNITHESVLNANPYVLNALRSAVFEFILGELSKDVKNNDAVIINVHSIFFWKKIFMRAYDKFYVNHFNPDKLITFVDDAGRIKDNLNARLQWKNENLSVEEVLLWQNVEVEISSSWADMLQKDFYVLSVNQSLETLYKMAFCPQMEPIYISMPMTHLPQKYQKEVTQFINKLEDYFIVFDPRTIEIGVTNLTKKSLVTYNQTVNRDLYWLIKQSKKIISFFPIIVSSPGVINELREGYETNKDVWLVYPSESASPFLTYFCNKLFKNKKEFFKFLSSSKYKPYKI
jgi:adenylate kinase